MKKMILIAAFTAGLGCDAANPVGPSPVTAATEPMPHATVADAGPPHDLTVSITGTLHDGQIAYLCSTQPRQYCSPDGGTCQTEIDFYVQADRCPAVRIP